VALPSLSCGTHRIPSPRTRNPPSPGAAPAPARSHGRSAKPLFQPPPAQLTNTPRPCPRTAHTASARLSCSAIEGGGRSASAEEALGGSAWWPGGRQTATPRAKSPARVCPSSVSRGQNRRGIGISQSKWPAPKMETLTARHPHRELGAAACREQRRLLCARARENGMDHKKQNRLRFTYCFIFSPVPRYPPAPIRGLGRASIPRSPRRRRCRGGSRAPARLPTRLRLQYFRTRTGVA
jgi:hypothetical protein